MKTIQIILTIFLITCYPLFSQKIPAISLNDAYKKELTLTTNDFIESFTYISLETSPSCLIDAKPKIRLTDKYIIFINNTKCLLFDRSSGKFIRAIGSYGRGPGEYQSTRTGFFNENTLTLYFLGWNGNLLKYSLDGKQIGSVTVPNYNDSFTSPFFPENYDYTENNEIACNIFNSLGTQKILIMFFDENGKQTGYVPNRNITKEHKFSLTTGELRFYHFKDILLYHHRDNDTIFNITLEKTTPYLILKPAGKNKSQKSLNESAFMTNYLESQRFRFFNYLASGQNYFSIYDKSGSAIKSSEMTEGVKNNTDNFLPFNPVVTNGEEMLGTIQCSELKAWLDKNPVAKEKLPENLRELSKKELTDNPIVVIAKLKK